MSIKDSIKDLAGRVKRFFSRLWNGRHVIGDLMKHKHRFVVLDTDTYKEKISFQLSGINLFVFLGITALVLVFLTALLLAFTPLRELIPGYSNAAMVEQTYANARVVDSLEVQLQAQEELLADIQYIMLGKDPATRHSSATGMSGDSVKVEPTPYLHSAEDSLLRAEMEERGGDRHYAVPLTGKVVRKFDSRNYSGTLIEGRAGDKVCSVQSGIILLADKGSDDVYTIVIQHGGIDLSLYKATGTLLQQSGATVMADEPILQLKQPKGKEAPTLYFELHKAGEAVDAAKWIEFRREK